MVTIMEIISSPLLLFLVVIGLMYITEFSMVEFPEEKYKFLGPSVYERTAEDFSFVKGDRPLIYISLGTVLKGAVSFFQNCIEAFRDEDADVFVTHGGMNSVSEALVFGTPMVVIPFVSDQPVNARCVEKLGAGKKLEYSAVSKNVLKEKVFSVIMDREIRNNMEKVKQMIKAAPGNEGGAEMIIRYYEKHEDGLR